ncbi:MAG: Hpt domain-containing protein [Cucumibacter sp.]
MIAADAAIADLRRRFRQRAFEDAAEIERLAEGLEAAAPDVGTREYVRRVAHKLAGAAGTFGFASIGDCAAQLEDMAVSPETDAEVAEACRTVAVQIRGAITADIS